MRVAYRQGVEEYSFRGAKDGGIRPDSQTQGGHGNHRKHRVTRQLPGPEPHIPPKGRKREKATRLPMALSYQGGIAKLTARSETGLFRGHTLAKVRCREQLEGGLQLIGQLAIRPHSREPGF